MSREEDSLQVIRRLDELAVRANRTGLAYFTPFLSPAEANRALESARKQQVNVKLWGGFEMAERCIACFWAEEEPLAFPIAVLELTWPHQSAPGHRDVLGSVMGLGLKRQCIGDIVVLDQQAYLFCEAQMATHIASSLTSAGRIHLQVTPMEEVPQLEAPKGNEVRDTVASLRLDAVIAAGFDLSRTAAAEFVAAGRVKLRHLPTERSDARVQEGDTISVRGKGRLVVTEVGNPTKKGRLPLRLMRYGEKK